MKTYYDILEVSRYASDEVINRAHKILVKRYHPDLQTTKEALLEAEEQIKKINEAYEILSDKEKKLKYDQKLEILLGNEKNSSNASNYTNSVNNNSTNFNNVNKYKTQKDYINTDVSDAEIEYFKKIKQQEIEQEIIKAKQDIINKQIEIENKIQEAYYDRLRKMGYKIVRPFSFREFMTKVLIILVFILIGFIMFKVPLFSNRLYELQKSNKGLDILISILRKIFGG